MPDFPPNALRTQFTFCETFLLGRLGWLATKTSTNWALTKDITFLPHFMTPSITLHYIISGVANHNLAVQRKSFLSLDILLWAYDDEDY